MAPLDNKKIRELKGLGHHLKPIIMIGKAGVNQSLIDSLDQALHHHELVKVKIHDTTDMDRKEFARDLAEQSASELVQVIGKTVLLYRKRKKKDEEKDEKKEALPLAD